jgi:UDP-N-acetylglucosamine--N-acetylmuramyl-(pentapeptide) pyrophosphoryl-undecaprenol N-acetylglucosamine transferase
MHDKRSARVLIMAGGTGGHVFPGLAVAHCLQEAHVDVAWLGTQRGIEAELVPAKHIPLNTLEVEGVRGRGPKALMRAPLLLWRSISQALRVMRQFQPDVVLGMGGFASAPGAVAARLKGIPIIVHEQNAIAGTTNRIVSRFATRVLSGFPDALPRAQWCGNPLRPEILALQEPQQRLKDRRGQARLLVLGGSRGAKAVNQLIPAAVALIDPSLRPNILHQAGGSHAAMTKAVYATLAVDARVVPFIDDMADAYAWADFVICRAGALTVAEVAAAGVGALFIPFPYAIDDHQTANGQWLVDRGGALLRQQSTLTAQALSDVILDIASHPEKRLRMAIAARDGAKNDAAMTVSNVCMEYLNVGS